MSWLAVRSVAQLAWPVVSPDVGKQLWRPGLLWGLGGGVAARLPPEAGTRSWLSGPGSTAQALPQVDPSQWGFIDSGGR